MKRFIVFSICLVVLCTLFISASAYPMTIISQPRDLVVSVPEGYSSFSLSFIVNNAVSYQWYYSSDNINWSVAPGDSSITSTYVLDFNSSSVNANTIRFFYCVATNSDGLSINSRIATVEFVRSRFQYYSTSALRYVTSWVGSVVSSLTEGPLSGLLPVLAIGIAVAALLLVVKIVKLFSWGA